MRPWLLRPPVSGLCSRSLTSGFFFVISPKSWLDMPRRPGDVGLYLMIAMGSDSLEELDVVAGLERDDGLLPRRPHASEATHALLLAANDEGANAGDGHVEQRLHRVPDLDLVGVLRHFEHDLLGVL